jgi:hypothetical protein
MFAELSDDSFDRDARHALEVRRLREALERVKEAWELSQAENERLREELRRKGG